MHEEEVGLTFDTGDGEPVVPVRHPWTVFFHLFFRIASLLTYVLCGWFSNSFVTSFIVIVVLCALDFWTVKNVSGRLLVGLRWWNRVDEDGISKWVFESKKNGTPPLPSESRVFWVSLVACPVIWVFFSITCLFTLKLNWLMVSIVGASMTLSNLYGYVRCVQGQASLKGIATQYLGQQVLKEAMSQATKTDAPPAQ